jgi:hypothetical protein
MTTEVSHLLTKIHDAGLAAEAWPEAKALTDGLGVGGAACIVFNKRTKGVDWVCFSGLSSALESKYANHYAHLEPFSPLLNVAPGWQKKCPNACRHPPWREANGTTISSWPAAFAT